MCVCVGVLSVFECVSAQFCALMNTHVNVRVLALSRCGTCTQLTQCTCWRVRACAMSVSAHTMYAAVAAAAGALVCIMQFVIKINKFMEMSDTRARSAGLELLQQQLCIEMKLSNCGGVRGGGGAAVQLRNYSLASHTHTLARRYEIKRPPSRMRTRITR